jgi:hypothetical protein
MKIRKTKKKKKNLCQVLPNLKMAPNLKKKLMSAFPHSAPIFSLGISVIALMQLPYL